MELGENAKSFKLETAVCNHGFFMMAPNYWIPTTKTLMRVLRLSDSITCVTVSISHPSNQNFLQVEVIGMDKLSSQDEDVILSQVGRMLRISAQDERNIEEFHKVNPQAKEKGFGRLFRSPSLFEDVIKSILLCNCP
ncbi:DNA glycosylase [Olea europaea subsp. europaea]|uniref:DNA glycosylase n=1 Tax=Olea europaea subsp. europaea TaxID=158383 RepID=A0A8S0SNS7_OLEEU|nr:DNA glycosylase [Olea europaea subsp. europaea]